jgi:hypothetical protein
VNRWSLGAVQDRIFAPAPTGLVDVWDAVQDGWEPSADAVASIRKANQTAMVEAVGTNFQRVIASAGVIGFRPEQFSILSPKLDIDVRSIVIAAIAETGLDLSALGPVALAALSKVLELVTTAVGEVIINAIGAYPVIGAVVEFVYRWVKYIVDNVRADRDDSETTETECPPPSYSAAIDRAQSQDCIERMRLPDWTALFSPVTNTRVWVEAQEAWGGIYEAVPAHWNILGFNCCPATIGGGRVIAPVGMIPGTRRQFGTGNPIPFPDFDGFGFGLLPMVRETYGKLLPADQQRGESAGIRIARALVTGEQTWGREIGDLLPLTAAASKQAWALLWSRGPTAFTLDANTLLFRWANYFGDLTDQILGNPETLEGSLCGDWSWKKRCWFVENLLLRLGCPGYENPGGGGIDLSKLTKSAAISRARGAILVDSDVCKSWFEFDRYQKSLLRRIGIAYVDAETCHPAWRDRVHQAQVDYLTHPTAVCNCDDTSIPNAEFAAAVRAAQYKKGALCAAGYEARTIAFGPSSATTGPSLDPLGEDAPEIPEAPQHGDLPPRSKAHLRAPAGSSGSGGGFALALLGLGLGAAILNRKGRR